MKIKTCYKFNYTTKTIKYKLNLEKIFFQANSKFQNEKEGINNTTQSDMCSCVYHSFTVSIPHHEHKCNYSKKVLTISKKEKFQFWGSERQVMFKDAQHINCKYRNSINSMCKNEHRYNYTTKDIK